MAKSNRRLILITALISSSLFTIGLNLIIHYPASDTEYKKELNNKIKSIDKQKDDLDKQILQYNKKRDSLNRLQLNDTVYQYYMKKHSLNR